MCQCDVFVKVMEAKFLTVLFVWTKVKEYQIMLGKGCFYVVCESLATVVGFR